MEDAPPQGHTRTRGGPGHAVRHVVAGLALLFAWLAFTVPAGGFDTDLDYWIRWSHRIARFGLANLYGGVGESSNYLPLFPWMLVGLNRLVGGPLTRETVVLVKVIGVAFTFAISLVAVRVLARRGRDPALAFLVAVNPALLYNAWVWGQVDAIHTALVAGAWAALAAGAATTAVVLVVLALNMKLAAVIFVPFFGWALLHVIGRRWSRWGSAVAGAVATQLVLLVPFMNQRALQALRQNVVGMVGYFQNVSLNAYNVWYLLSSEPGDAEDTQAFFHGTYRSWGTVLLLVALLAVAVPFAIWVRRLWREGELDRLDEHGFLFLALAGIAFFLFPTQVHERYLYPAVALLAVHAVVQGRYGAYALLSLAHLLNLEDVLRWRGIEVRTGPWLPRAIAVAILWVFVVGARDAWRAVPRRRRADERGREAAAA